VASTARSAGAILGWTIDLAIRLGGDGVRVNAIIPGYIGETEVFGDRMTGNATTAS
jgi:3-oxoacyl-[acyl-carrier protein] reductase